MHVITLILSIKTVVYTKNVCALIVLQSTYLGSRG